MSENMGSLLVSTIKGIRRGELNVISSGVGVGKSVFGEQKIYPDGSRGMYTCTCRECREPFIGHKRDSLCQKCEDNIPKQLDMELN